MISINKPREECAHHSPPDNAAMKLLVSTEAAPTRRHPTPSVSDCTLRRFGISFCGFSVDERADPDREARARSQLRRELPFFVRDGQRDFGVGTGRSEERRQS